MKLWPLSKVAYRLGRQPILGSLIRPWFSHRIHEAVIIPVNEVVRSEESVVLPYSLLTPLVDQASACFVMTHCMCRRNENCQAYPHGIGCLFLGDGAAQINPALGRLISAAEARAHIQQAMETGLVPLIAHTTLDSYMLGIPYRRMLTVCFCCDCCCAVRHGMRMGPREFWDIVVRLPGLSVEVGEDCLGCGVCTPVCSVQAIQVVGDRAEIGSQCKGCGRCAQACPVEAIHLRLEDGLDIGERLRAQIQKRTDITPNGKHPTGDRLAP